MMAWHCMVHWILVVAWHRCTRSWWWHGTGDMNPGCGVALVYWILVVAQRGTGYILSCPLPLTVNGSIVWCIGSLSLGPGGGVPLVHWVLVVNCSGVHYFGTLLSKAQRFIHPYCRLSFIWCSSVKCFADEKHAIKSQ